jgi:hypothetical protein
MIPKGLANAIIVLVSLVWVSNFAASVWLPDYQTDGTIHFVFMTIVGGAFAFRRNPGDPPNPIERMAQSLTNRQPPPPPDGEQE